VPFTVRVPVFMIGPASVSAESPVVPDGSTVSDPPFWSPDATVRPRVVVLLVLVALVVLVAPVVLVVLVAPVLLVALEALAVPMVRLLPGDRVSSPMENDASERRTVALPEMQASTLVLSGTPVVQLAAEPQSGEEPLPVQVSLQLSVSVGGALPDTKDEASKSVVVPATIRKPAATAPNFPAERRR
jgi:hypothetical protein